MLSGKGGMHFENSKHLFWYRIICEKGLLQRCFAIFLWKVGWRRLVVWVVLELGLIRILFVVIQFFSISLLVDNIVVLKFYFFIYCHPALILTLCSSFGFLQFRNLVLQFFRFDLAQRIGAVRCLIPPVLGSLSQENSFGPKGHSV